MAANQSLPAVDRVPVDVRASVSDEVREVLLGGPRAQKACDHCDVVASVVDWPVEVSVDGDRVAYVGRCPACDGHDGHSIVDVIR